MKKYLLVISVIFFLSLFSATTFAQKKSYVPEKGYWVLVSNVHEKNNTTVRFYDDGSNLMYEEKVTGVKLNINRRKTLKHLKSALEKTMLAWNGSKEIKYNSGLLAGIIKRK